MSQDETSKAKARAQAKTNGHGRIFTLADLIEPEALERLRRAFSELSDSNIAICDHSGLRIDMPDPDAPHECDACGTSEYFSVPVTWKKHTLGRVVVFEENPSPHAREFAVLIADVLAGMCRTQAHIRKRVDELTTVYDLGGLFAHSADLDTILAIATKRVCEAMNVKAASVRLLDTATRTLVIAGEHNLSERYLRREPVKLEDNPIDSLAFSGEVVYLADARTDPRVRNPELARSEGIVSGLCAPLSYRGHTVGVLRIYSGRRKKFSRFDKELLQAVASQAAAAIIHSRLYEESVAAAKNERQLAYAGEVQRRMLPLHPPQHDRIAFGQVYEPSLDVGGDFFDYLELPNGNVGLAIADVVGKGLPGAIMMASVRSALRAHAHSIFDINEIISHVNRHLCRDTLISEFATLCYGVFAPDGSRLTYCNAGHNPPLLLRGDKFIELDTGGMVIGVVPDEVYAREVLELTAGDVLVFYTDGVTEALDFDETLYGMDRFLASIIRHRDAAAQTLASQLLWDVRRFVGLAPQSDDISIVVAKVG